MVLHYVSILLDFIIIVLQVLAIRSLKKNDKFFEFVKDYLWNMTIDIGKLKNRIKED